MTKTGTLTVAALGGLLAAWNSPVKAEGHAVAAKAGMLGLGVEYTWSVNDRLGLRLGLNGSQVGFDAEESGIAYGFDLVWDSISAAVDFHPTGGPLRVSAGVLGNDNRLEATSRANGNVTVGDTTYTPEEIGTLYGVADFDDTAAFASIGWDWSRKRERFGVSFDLGVVDQGAPRVSLIASGPIAGDPSFASDIDAEEVELSAALDDFDLLPFASLGFVFRF